nr:alanine--tRNA ligase [Desulfobacterales bacterium]
DDPTLLFTNAGMVQFKRVFLGEEKRDYVRAASSQKCVRAGGKHNDLENVGRTRRHHTFFEMLGNFSFGDYFKERAIELGWELLTHDYGLPVERLWVSIYEQDDEAYDVWHNTIGISDERIVRLGKKDNFWSMGDTGPCGPCSEILIDQGEEFSCGRPNCRVGCDCDRYLELWNLVFMQYNRDETGTMTPLPSPSIDTGMGLERIAAVVQGVPSNYDTDLFLPILKVIEDLSERPYGKDKTIDTSMRVIADHGRAATFLIGDGVLPSNEGRGYVLRRIIRRAIRHGRTLNLNGPFLYRTAETVSELMSPAYPELLDARTFIEEVIRQEEERFSGTLEHGLQVLDEALEELKAKGTSKVPGDLIFKLYDTFGFPVDIVQDIVRDDGLTLDMEGFEQAMEEQRARSRTSRKGAVGILGTEPYTALSAKGVRCEFVGYDHLKYESKILLLVKQGMEVEEVHAGDEVDLVVMATPFYGEAGGQVGDKGRIYTQDFEMEVHNTFKDPHGLIIHRGKIKRGTASKGQTVTLSVDKELRRDIAMNHTATHILHAALRRILGNHVKQSGSLVAPNRLRFDFTHLSAVEEGTLMSIEDLVNERIRENIPVSVVEMDADEAIKSGAIALFEEKYSERVRVVSIANFSKELCGGTHVEQTGNIGFFRILTESSVAAGVRRIEAVTGRAALRHSQNETSTIRLLTRMIKARPEELADRLEKLLDSQRTLEREVSALKARLAALESERSLKDVKKIAGVPVLARKVNAKTPAELRDMADKYKEKIESGVIVLGSTTGQKVLLVAVVTQDYLKNFHAGKIVKEVAAILGGGGGGRPDMAQAGGSKPDKLDDALNMVYKLIAKQKEG